MVGFAAVGYATPKITVFGAIATVGIWSVATAMGIDTDPGLWHILGLIVDLWFLFPETAQTVIMMSGSPMESVVASFAFLILGAAYVAGLYIGLIWWPEAVLLRLFI